MLDQSHVPHGKAFTSASVKTHHVSVMQSFGCLNKNVVKSLIYPQMLTRYQVRGVGG